jgi:putative DNA primase/helicase
MPPPAVQAATAEYFADQDLFTQWLDECCDQDPAYGCASAVLSASWAKFLIGHGESPRSSKSLTTLLKRQGFKQAKDCPLFRGRGFFGLRLCRPDAPPHWSDREAASHE